MSISRTRVGLVVAAGLFVHTTWAQPPRQLTPRELFYSSPAVKKTDVVKPAGAGSPAKPVTVSKAPAKAKSGSQTASGNPAGTSRPAVDVPDPGERPASPATSLPAQQQGMKLMNASNAAPAPLGLRYSILKYAGDNDYIEVDPDLTFRSGDRIKVRVEVNDAAYLYVVMKGSSGNWRVMFPSAEYDSGDNRVFPGREYDIPKNTRFVFDERTGEEKLFLVLSRKPEKDLEQLIYKLDGRPAQPANAAPDKSGFDGKKMFAMNNVNIEDSIISGIRGKMLARDLVFEKVETKGNEPGKKDEAAVYVVNPNATGESWLVVDIGLKHR